MILKDHKRSHYPENFWGHRLHCYGTTLLHYYYVTTLHRLLALHCASRYIFSLSRDLAKLIKPCDCMVICLYGYKAVKEHHHCAKFCGHRYCGVGDIIILVCHVILQDHVTKGWSNIVGRRTSWLAVTPKFH